MMRPAPFHLRRNEVEALVGGTWCGRVNHVTCHGLSIDSRDVRPGCIFACITGRRVDGHDFADTAVGEGAALVVAERELDVPVPVLVVSDVTLALGILAAEFRRRFAGATWITISGANGKTTVKEMLAAACRSIGPVAVTKGNRNNQLGVPITVLDVPAEARIVIAELGADREGEIDYLAAIVQPHVGVVTSIGPAHLEGYGDLAGLARGESEAFRHVPETGTVYFGSDGLAELVGEDADEILAIVRRRAGARRLVEVGGDGLSIRGETGSGGVWLETDAGRTHLRLFGRHNLANASLVYHLARDIGAQPADVLRDLAGVLPVPGRLRRIEVGRHVFFDDCYNANPSSMRVALAELAQRSGARLAVLGGMRELGEQSDEFHRLLGREAARLGIPLITIGADADPIAAGYEATGAVDCHRVADYEEGIAAVRRRLAIGPTSVLVKASRASGLERVIDGVITALDGSEEDGAC